MPVGGPRPIFQLVDEAACDRVAVHVLQFFDALVVGEDVEVVVAGLPEGTFFESPGDGDLQGLEGFGEGSFRGFAQEEMDVLRHDDVAEEFELVLFAGAFEGVEEDVS